MTSLSAECCRKDALQGADLSIIAESPAMREVVRLARRIAPTKLPVLLVGETGSGKEVLAQAIHRWSGRSGPMIEVNCGALSEGMVTAELFGHRRGAYTSAVDSMPGLVEEASGGTLFLDELASMPMNGQTALLRLLESGEVRRIGDRTKVRLDLRLIAAVQRDDRGNPDDTVRVDLFHRLAGMVIRLAPLRERPEDLFPLAQHLAGRLHRSIAESVGPLLLRHRWSGNARELRNVICRAAALCDAVAITPAALSEALDLGLGTTTGLPVVEHDGHEAGAMLAALCLRYQGRAAPIAAALGMAQSTMYRHLKRHGIRLRQYWRVSATATNPPPEREKEREREKIDRSGEQRWG